MTLAEQLAQFIADETPALAQLSQVAGGEVGPKLDGSAYGLGLLDTYIRNLTAEPDWSQATFFEGVRDIRMWLAVRVAYYLGLFARRTYGCEWYLCEDPESHVHQTPLMAVAGVEFSPLEVALAHVNRQLEGGLVQFFADLDAQVLKTGGQRH